MVKSKAHISTNTQSSNTKFLGTYMTHVHKLPNSKTHILVQYGCIPSLYLDIQSPKSVLRIIQTVPRVMH